MSLGSKEIMLRIKASTTIQPLFPAQMNFTLSTSMIIMLNAAKAQVPFPPRKMFFFFNRYTRFWSVKQETFQLCNVTHF